MTRQEALRPPTLTPWAFLDERLDSLPAKTTMDNGQTKPYARSVTPYNMYNMTPITY